jgi:2-desacetyl-2-hydroxyethyl bacteriochlorophyllide A dehydrogenase
MKALVAHGPYDLRVEETPEPVAGPGQVLVRVRAAGICGSDLHWYRGHRPLAFDNRVYGHEIAGEVAAVGDGVTDLAIGQRVGVEPLIGCDACPACAAGHYHLCPDLRHIGAYYSGGFAELTVAPRAKVFPLPATVSVEAAALLDGFAVAVHALHRLPLRDPAAPIAIIGAGTIGLQLLQVLRAAGARNLIVTARRPEQARVARALGAAEVVHGHDDPAAEVLRLTDGQGAAAVFETVGGSGATLAEAAGMVARGGRIGVLGVFPQTPSVDVTALLRREVDLIFCWSYAAWEGTPEYATALDLMAAGQIDAGPIITHRFPLDDGPAAFTAADDKAASGAIKVVLEPA